jgi:uncharacterized membrane protein HdeD (DUF308 family)
MDTIRNLRSLLFVEGVLFIILGGLAIIFPMISTLSVELFLGWIFLFAGLIQLYRAFKWRERYGLWWPLLNAILSIVVGALLLAYPLRGVLTLTILLIVYFILDGITKVIWAISNRDIVPWGWLIVSGLLSMAIAYIIWSGWPGTALWALGLLAGINLIFFGASLFGIGYGMPKRSDRI